MIYPEHKKVLKDAQGRYRTQSLFREFYIKDLEPLWSLKDEDSQGILPSLKTLYMECEDPTEYEFAMQAFGSWQHWIKIKSSAAIKAYIEDWPIELEVSLRSKGIRLVTQEALNGKSKFNAAKFLAEGQWKKADNKRGRPSKEELHRELKIAAKLDSEIGEDAARLGLHVIQGLKTDGS
jgi:hypothetical protein